MTDITDELEAGPWMESVAALLPPLGRDELPFTLGEAVAELGVWARDTRSESWQSKQNRESLDLDIAVLTGRLGPRLGAALEGLLHVLASAGSRPDIAASAKAFASIWSDPASISAAFRDLCEVATSPRATSWDLRPKAEILASQLRQPSRGFGVLSDAATLLAGDPRDYQIEAWLGEGYSAESLTAKNRLQSAERMLVAGVPLGNVVVWVLYERALVDWRVTVGPITFLRADIAIPDAVGEPIQNFPERDELRLIMERSFTWADLEQEASDGSNRLVLARVDLGFREIPGAVQDARRMVEAILSIAVGAGGVSWQDTGSTATVVDGEPTFSSRGRGGRRPINFDDTFGMGATSQVISDAAEVLNAAMAAQAMPDQLVEALLAMREAGMINHRDVSLYGARAVTPRVATALEDHAIELLSSVGALKPSELTAALQENEVEWQFDQLTLKAVMAPFDRRTNDINTYKEFERLERLISKFDNAGMRTVSIRAAHDLHDEVMAMPMNALARADFQSAIAIVRNSVVEACVLEDIKRDVVMMRSRHRRVRNAINHGNPLTDAALSSVRSFSARTSKNALNIAIRAYSLSRSMCDLIREEQSVRTRSAIEMAAGHPYLDRIET